MIVTSQEFVNAAKNDKYNGVPYSEMDCQSFVEHVLADCGIKKNWLGSNDMWRNMVIDKIDNTRDTNKYNDYAGYLCFTIKQDGKENKTRYKDGVNASHIGIVLDNGKVRHSTTGGVQYDTLNSGRWTHLAKHKDIVYPDDNNNIDLHAQISSLITDIDELGKALELFLEVFDR